MLLQDHKCKLTLQIGGIYSYCLYEDGPRWVLWAARGRSVALSKEMYPTCEALFQNQESAILYLSCLTTSGWIRVVFKYSLDLQPQGYYNASAENISSWGAIKGLVLGGDQLSLHLYVLDSNQSTMVRKATLNANNFSYPSSSLAGFSVWPNQQVQKFSVLVVAW